MPDPRKAAGSLNPLVFNFQKLGLELKCPLFLNLLRKPTLLPCNHIFCNVCIPKSSKFAADCPSFQQQFTDQEIRLAPYMDNVVVIYKNLDAAFSSTLLPMLSARKNDSTVNLWVTLLTPQWSCLDLLSIVVVLFIFVGCILVFAKPLLS